MRTFLILAGIVWALAGVGVFVTAKSAIHEILACLAISFGIMFWAFAAVLEQLQAVAKVLTLSARPSFPNQRESEVRANGQATADSDDCWRPSQAAQDLINGGR